MRKIFGAYFKANIRRIHYIFRYVNERLIKNYTRQFPVGSDQKEFLPICEFEWIFKAVMDPNWQPKAKAIKLASLDPIITGGVGG